MELLNIVRARSIWLFDIRDINPRGKHIESALIMWLNDHYGFSKYPSSIYDRDQDGGLTFEMGSFQVKEDSLVSVDLKIYNDGVVADTRSSTNDTDAFIGDVLRLAVQDFGLIYTPETIRQKIYLSEVHVRPDRALSQINPRLEAFARKISSLTGRKPGTEFELASLGFWSDPSLTPQMSFQFERQLNIPFSERRYYSRAPLHTEDHLNLLDEFEDLLVG